MITIDNLPAEIEHIYRKIISSHIKTLAITATNRQEGCTTVALMLANRHAAQGKSTLIVDLNLKFPMLQHVFHLQYQDKSSLMNSMQANITTTAVDQLSALAAPINSQFLLQLMDYDNIKKILEQWSSHYSLVVIDCSNLSYVGKDVIPAELICTVADSCITVVMAARTQENRILEAMGKLHHAHILGTIINDQCNPRLTDQICQSTHFLDRLMPKSMHRLRNIIRHSSFLSIEV